MSCFSDETTYIVCDSKKVLLNCQPKQICSNSSYLFILSDSGDVLCFSKALHFIKQTGIQKCRSIAANDEELYGVSSMFAC